MVDISSELQIWVFILKRIRHSLNVAFQLSVTWTVRISLLLDGGRWGSMWQLVHCWDQLRALPGSQDECELLMLNLDPSPIWAASCLNKCLDNSFKTRFLTGKNSQRLSLSDHTLWGSPILAILCILNGRKGPDLMYHFHKNYLRYVGFLTLTF